MKKIKVLLLGHSDLSKKIIIKTFIKNDIDFCVASRSEKKKFPMLMLNLVHTKKVLKNL